MMILGVGKERSGTIKTLYKQKLFCDQMQPTISEADLIRLQWDLGVDFFLTPKAIFMHL